MATTVLLASPTVLNQMKQAYHAHLVLPFPPYTIFAAKKNGTMITAYTSGKVVFQGHDATPELDRWIHAGATIQDKKEAKETSPSRLPEGFETWSVVGSDEVGTGSYFGPLTVVATFVDDTAIPLLKELGVKDSKHLTDPEIIRIAKDLLVTVPYSSLSMDAKTYNRIQPTMSQGKMKAILHNRALLNVLEKIHPRKPKGILIDEFAQPSTYFRYLSEEKEVLKDNVYFATKGESHHLAVAAASIIARYSFLKRLEKDSARVGLTLPSGASAQSDVAAARVLKKGGMDLLGTVAKLHFANTQKAKNIAGYKDEKR